MGISIVTSKPSEVERRRAGASGSPVILADGAAWLLASPVFQPRGEGLTRPLVDQPLDNLFENAIRGKDLGLCDLFEICKELLFVNYVPSPDELVDLLEFAPGAESRQFVESVIAALFGSGDQARAYTQWIRASLLVNGIGSQEIPARDILDVMAILVATNRTVPLSKFAEACRELDETARLDILI